MSQLPPPPGPAAVSRLELSDLLLVIILALGGTRLLGILLLGGGEIPTSSWLIPPALLVQSGIMTAAIYIVAIQGRGLSWGDLGLRPGPRPWRKRAILAAVAAFPLVGLVNTMVGSAIGETPVNPQFQIVAPAGFSWPMLIAMLITLGIVVPIAEELLFRGVLYGWLRARWGAGPAMVVSAIGFAGLHGIVWLIPAIAVLGLLLAWVYEKSGSLWASIMTHGIFNAISTTLLYVAIGSGVLPP